ncbi:MAG: hypothetical protein ACFFAU_10495 [Candidatus Hodarchaeota archaeon]
MPSSKIDPPPEIFEKIYTYVSNYSTWKLRKDRKGIHIIDIYPIGGSWTSQASLLLGFESSATNTEQIEVYSHFYHSIPYKIAIVFVLIFCFPLSFLVTFVNPFFGILMIVLLSSVLISTYIGKGSRKNQVENLLQQLASVPTINLHEDAPIERIYGIKNK